jgi:hypothetical protein
MVKLNTLEIMIVLQFNLKHTYEPYRHGHG